MPEIGLALVATPPDCSPAFPALVDASRVGSGTSRIVIAVMPAFYLQCQHSVSPVEVLPGPSGQERPEPLSPFRLNGFCLYLVSVGEPGPKQEATRQRERVGKWKMETVSTDATSAGGLACSNGEAPSTGMGRRGRFSRDGFSLGDSTQRPAVTAKECDQFVRERRSCCRSTKRRTKSRAGRR